MLTVTLAQLCDVSFPLLEYRWLNIPVACDLITAILSKHARPAGPRSAAHTSTPAQHSDPSQQYVTMEDAASKQQVLPGLPHLSLQHEGGAPVPPPSFPSSLPVVVELRAFLETTPTIPFNCSPRTLASQRRCKHWNLSPTHVPISDPNRTHTFGLYNCASIQQAGCTLCTASCDVLTCGQPSYSVQNVFVQD